MKQEEEKKEKSDFSQKEEKELSNKELQDEQLKKVSGGVAQICNICGVQIPCACIP